MHSTQHRKFAFLVTLFLLCTYSEICSAQGLPSLGDVFGGLGDAVGDLVNDPTKPVRDVAKELEKLTPVQMSECLNQIEDGARFGEIVKELSKTTPADLGKALSDLDPSKAVAAFNAIESNIGDIASNFPDSRKLGQVLNQLSVDKMKLGLEQLGSRLSEVADNIASDTRLGDALSQLSDDNLRDCLKGLKRSITNVAQRVSPPEKLAKALDQLTSSKIAQGLRGLGSRMAQVADRMTNDAQLGKALGRLSENDIRGCLDGIHRSISTVAASISDNGTLGRVLNQLSAAKIKEGLEGLGTRIADVADYITDAAKLGVALDQLSVAQISRVLDRIPVDRLRDVVANLSDAHIADSLNALLNSPARALAVLGEVTNARLSNILKSVSPDVFNKMLKDLAGDANLAKLFQVLDAQALSALPWETLDKLKLPWNAIDPAKVPWDRIDLSAVKWEQIDPSHATKQAGKWFSERVDQAKSDAINARNKAKGELDAAITSGTLVIRGLPGDVASVTSGIGEKFETGREFVDAQAHKLEQSIRTEVGRGVEAIKETPWYQALRELLVKYTHVTAYELDTDLVLTFNPATDSYHVDIDFVPGVTLTSQDLQTLMAGELPLPNVDVIEVAATAASGVVLRKGEDNYEAVRRTAYDAHGRTNVYFSSKRFVEWASSETVVNEGFKVIATAGYGPEDALLEAEHQIVAEMDDIYAWLKLRLEREKQSQV